MYIYFCSYFRNILFVNAKIIYIAGSLDLGETGLGETNNNFEIHRWSSSSGNQAAVQNETAGGLTGSGGVAVGGTLIGAIRPDGDPFGSSSAGLGGQTETGARPDEDDENHNGESNGEEDNGGHTGAYVSYLQLDYNIYLERAFHETNNIKHQTYIRETRTIIT